MLILMIIENLLYLNVQHICCKNVSCSWDYPQNVFYMFGCRSMPHCLSPSNLTYQTIIPGPKEYLLSEICPDMCFIS